MSATMAQFDVFVNPFATARQAYPFVVAMQSDLTVNGAEQLIAPMASINHVRSTGRIMPSVALKENELAVVVPRLAVVRSRDLQEKVGSIAAARAELLAAIDYLFFGV